MDNVILHYVFDWIGRSVLLDLVCVPYSWFEKWADAEREKRNDDQEYELVKNAIGRKIINQIAHLYPNIKVYTKTWLKLNKNSKIEIIISFHRAQSIMCTWARQLITSFTSMQTKERVSDSITFEKNSNPFSCHFLEQNPESKVFTKRFAIIRK